MYFSECLPTLYGYPFFPKEDTVKLFLEGTLPFVVWNNIYKRKSLIDYRIQWDENIKSKQDSAFNIISLLRGMKFEYIKNAKVDYYWRVAHNPNSITANIRKSSHLDSHVYYLNALIKELITAQFISYKNSLNAYLESFIPIFAAGKSKRHLNDLLNCEYLKKQRWFRFKLSILGYSLMYIVNPIHKGRIEWLLFPLLYRSRRKRVSQMKKQTKELTKIFQ